MWWKNTFKVGRSRGRFSSSWSENYSKVCSTWSKNATDTDYAGTGARIRQFRIRPIQPFYFFWKKVGWAVLICPEIIDEIRPKLFLASAVLYNHLQNPHLSDQSVSKLSPTLQLGTKAWKNRTWGSNVGGFQQLTSAANYVKKDMKNLGKEIRGHRVRKLLCLFRKRKRTKNIVRHVNKKKMA